ncbi:MAG TPA: hypothetical protein VFJ81_09355, partial [Gemmatimonadales bacterium]|nr:hypothetical protein [Gemmatimonadales bacterium]
MKSLRSWSSWLARALVAMPLAAQAATVFFLGVNVLVWDEFYYVDMIRQARAGENWLPWLLLQHNEHRVVPMKLAMVPLALLTRWNMKAEMYFSAFLAALIVLGLWRLYRHAGGRDLLLFAPAAWLACNLAGYQNMLYGMMMCFYFTVLGVVWALVFLARRTLGGLLLAMGCGVMASFSILNGFVVWPAGLLALLAWRERPGRIALWIAAGLASVLVYLRNFQIAPNTHPVALDPAGLVRIARFTVTALGAPLGAGSVPWSAALGLTVLAAVLALAIRWRREGRERWAAEALPAALVLFGLLSCGVIAVGRASDPIAAVESRYVAFSSLGLVGLYLCIARAAEGPAPW